MYDTAFLNGKIRQNNTWISANLYVQNGKIALIDEWVYEAKTTIDCEGKFLLPGLIDEHVHFALDLGFIKSVDDFYHGSKAAAYGGVTTVIDFLDPVDNEKDLVKAYQKRCEEAKDSVVDYTFHATLKAPTCDLEAFVVTMKSLEIDTLKVFTTYSESGRRTSDEAIKTLLELTTRYDFLLVVHVENDDLIRLDEGFKPSDLPLSRPAVAETLEALKLASYVKSTGGKLLMVHLSAGSTLQTLKDDYPGLLNTQFFIESCPQYFTFTEAILKEPKGYLYTCAPPLRSDKERATLLSLSDDVYTIGTDHCAFMQADKQKTRLIDTPLGIGGVEQSFQIMMHHLGESAIEKMTENPAKLNRLPGKGKLLPGYDADVVMMEYAHGKIRKSHGKADYTVYHNHPVDCMIHATMIRGNFVLKDGTFFGGKGRLVKGVHPDA